MPDGGGSASEIEGRKYFVRIVARIHGHPDADLPQIAEALGAPGFLLRLAEGG